MYEVMFYLLQNEPPRTQEMMTAAVKKVCYSLRPALCLYRGLYGRSQHVVLIAT